MKRHSEFSSLSWQIGSLGDNTIFQLAEEEDKFCQHFLFRKKNIFRENSPKSTKQLKISRGNSQPNFVKYCSKGPNRTVTTPHPLAVKISQQ